MNPEHTPVNVLTFLDTTVTPRTLPFFDGHPWEVSIGATAIAVTKAQPTPPVDSRVTDRADYYLWCGANICIHQPPEQFRGKINGYVAAITPNVQGAFRYPSPTTPVDRWLQLARWAPTTTQGATTYSSGMTESVSGNIGFFGETPTGGISAGVTWSNNQSRSSPDVDIAAYTRADSATFMFNLNAPNTLSATSSMEIYVQSLYCIKGFSPMYLAYRDYTNQAEPSTVTASEALDPSTGLPPLTSKDFTAWNTATPLQKETLVSLRALAITKAISLSCQIDLEVIMSSNILPIAPVTVTCGTPSVVTTNDAWQAFLTTPPNVSLPLSNAIGTSSIVLGYLIYGDPNYQAGNVDENPTTLYDYQMMRSWNGEYSFSIDPQTGAVTVTQLGTGKVMWHSTGDGPRTIPFNPIIRPGITPPESVSGKALAVTSANAPEPNKSSGAAPPKLASTLTGIGKTDSPEDASPPIIQPGPYKLVFSGSHYNVIASNNHFANTLAFDIQPVPSGVIPPGSPDAHPYRRLELTGDGTLRSLDSSGTVLWASTYPSATSGSNVETSIVNSLGGPISTIGAVGSGIVKGIGGGIVSGVGGVIGTPIGNLHI